MAVGSQDVRFYLGEDVVLLVTIYQADDSTPQDVTGWAVSFVLETVPAGTVLLTKTVGHGVVLTDPANGMLAVALARADTVAMRPGSYSFYVARTDAGHYAVLTTGVLTLRQA